MSSIEIRDSGDLRKYRTEVPNLVFEMGLSPYALALYMHFRRTAGDDGKCWKSTRTLASDTGISAGTISKARKELEGRDLIAVQYPENNNKSIIVTITDIWPENFQHFAGRKPNKKLLAEGRTTSKSSQENVRPAEPNSRSRPSGGERNGVQSAQSCEGAIKTLREKLAKDSESDKLQWESLVNDAANRENSITTLSRWLKAADQDSITLSSFARNAIESTTVAIQEMNPAFTSRTPRSPGERRKEPTEEGTIEEVPVGADKPPQDDSQDKENVNYMTVFCEASKVLGYKLAPEDRRDLPKNLKTVASEGHDDTFMRKVVRRCLTARADRQHPLSPQRARDELLGNVTPIKQRKQSENRDIPEEAYDREAY